MDAADFLEPEELDAMRPRAAPAVPGDACDGCGGPITWVDAAFVCSSGCTWCGDCAEASELACPTCSGTLRRTARARPLPRSG